MALVATALVVVGCGTSRQDGTADAVNKSGASTLPESAETEVTATADREATDRAAVDAIYRRFWDEGRTFDQRYPESVWKKQLSEVAADPLLSRALDGARLHKQNNIVLYGQMVPHPTVKPINGNNTATVIDCQNADHAGQANATTGKPINVGISHNPVRGTVTRTRDGWRVTDITFPGGNC